MAKAPRQKTVAATQARAKRATTQRQGGTVQWTLRGVTLKTQSAVAKAAREDGVAVGKWVNEKLHELTVARSRGAAPAQDDSQAILKKIQDLSRKVDLLLKQNEERDKAEENLRDTARSKLDDITDQIGESAAAAKQKADELFSDILDKAQSVISDAREKADAKRDRGKPPAGGDSAEEKQAKAGGR